MDKIKISNDEVRFFIYIKEKYKTSSLSLSQNYLEKEWIEYLDIKNNLILDVEHTEYIRLINQFIEELFGKANSISEHEKIYLEVDKYIGLDLGETQRIKRYGKKEEIKRFYEMCYAIDNK